MTELSHIAIDSFCRRLTHLSRLLNKYGHRWSEHPSDRMYSWVDEYNGIKEHHPDAWEAYCSRNGLSRFHDAYDCMA